VAWLVLLWNGPEWLVRAGEVWLVTFGYERNGGAGKAGIGTIRNGQFRHGRFG